LLNFDDLKNNCDKINVIENLANKFESECKYSFPLFKYGLYVYYRSQGYSNDSPEVKRIQDNIIGGTIFDVLQLVPVVGEIGSVLLKGVDSLSAAIKRQVIANSEYIKKLDNLASEDIAEELVRVFARELKSQTQNEKFPVVIFMDTYEQLQNYVYQISSAKVSEEWLWARTGLIRRVPNVLWVLAGQRQVTWGKEDSFWNSEENIIFEQIDEIKDKALLKKMLSDIGISEPEIIDVIVEKTSGVPVHLALCKDTYFNLKKDGKQPMVSDFDMGYAQLAKRFIGGLNSELKDVVNILACLEKWTANDIEKLKISADVYEYILQLSFISSNNDIYYMHHSVQDIVYKECSSLIVNKCYNFFLECIDDKSLTVGEIKDYIGKKIKLEIRIIESEKDIDRRDNLIKKFEQDNLQYIRKYVHDYNFFQRIMDCIDGSSINELTDDSFKKTLKIYMLYHHVLNGNFSTVRSYVEEENILRGHTRLDKDTKGFLYLAMSYYESYMENYSDAKNYLLECVEIWKDREVTHELIDVLARLGRVCENLKQYAESEYYSNLGIEKIQELKIDTKAAKLYCSFYVNKCRIERHRGNYTAALEDLSEAEKILEPFADSDSDIILFEYTVIFEQYRFTYMAVRRSDLVREYAFKFAEYAIKGYQVSPSEINYRGLSIAYTVLAKASTKYDEKKEYFDKAIQIRKDIYQNQPISKNMNEYFYVISQAAHYVSKSDAEGYLKECLRILESEEGERLNWKYKYNVYQDEIDYYCNIGKNDTALEKLAVLEKALEDQKDKLTEEEYYKYLSRNFRKYATIYSKKDDYYKVIHYYEKENSMQYRLYKNFEAYADGDSFSESCHILALAYRHKKMLMRAVNYARQQIDIQERAFKEFKSYAIMKRLMDAYQIMAETYGLLQRDEDAINAYSKELQYAKMLYESNSDIKTLIKISSVYVLLEKYYIRRGDYDRLICDYTELLQTLGTFDGTGDEKRLKDLRNAIDYIKCMLGRLYYVTRTNLLEAREAIEASNCPYSDFTTEDKRFYLGKIDCLLINDMIERYYPDEEEKKRIMGSDNL
jgi:tetratricopeptide (TPR) repeat protein